MKKKLTINSLALGNLKQRRKQYTILIIGIILAIVFSSGTLFFISCNQASNEEFRRQNIGDYYGYYFNPPEFFDIEGGKKDGYIEKYGYAHILGYAYTDEERTDKGAAIAWLDDNAIDLYYIALKEGKYPENKGEIALESDAALRLGINAKIGEEISLSVLNANGTEFGNTATEKTYTIVGILTDKRGNLEYYSDTTPTMPTAFVCNKEDVDAGGKEILSLYFNPTKETVEKDVKVQDGEYYYISNVFEQEFLFNFYDTMRKQTVKNELDLSDLVTHVPSYYYNSNPSVQQSSILTITLTIVLMIASCIGIINAFSTNLQERRKQIGMLRAVGATRRQIINIFGRETFIIALICAPIGVAISYFGVKLFATLMGDDYIFIPDFKVLFGSAAISVVCVMLAALIPLFRASRIPPMQAIRNVELNRKMKRQKIKTQKQFNVPKLLANRSIKFYKGKQVGVSIILALTIFMSCFGLSVLKTEMNDSSWSVLNPSDYAIERRIYAAAVPGVNYPNMDKKISLNLVRDILDYPKFTNVHGYKECISYLTVDEYSDYMTLIEFSRGDRYWSETRDFTQSELEGLNFQELCDVWFSGEGRYYLELKEKSKSQQELFQMDIIGYDEQIVEKYENQFEVIDGKINIDKLNSGEEIILVANKKIGFGIDFDKDNRVYFSFIQNLDVPLPDWHQREGYKIYASQELEYKAGDTINLRTITSDATEVPESDYMIPGNLTVYDKEVKIGAIIAPPDNTAADMYARGHICIFSTTTGIEKISGSPVDYERLFIDYDGELDDDADTAATNYLQSLVAGSFEAESGYAHDKENQSYMRTLMISLLAIVILFFSICASIVNNALTAKIRESKKEIGTLRAVGASVKEITSSYVRQLISMFSWGCGVGFIGYILTHIIIKLVDKSSELSFEIWPAIIICVLLFSMCSLNLYLKVKKEMKNSIVENIREL